MKSNIRDSFAYRIKPIQFMIELIRAAILNIPELITVLLKFQWHFE